MFKSVSLIVCSGDILGATELQGPVNFNYKDLKAATNNFSEENKLGEGGFGDVYKVRWLNEIKISPTVCTKILNIRLENVKTLLFFLNWTKTEWLIDAIHIFLDSNEIYTIFNLWLTGFTEKWQNSCC